MFKFGKSTIENKLCTIIDEKLGREIEWNLKIPKEVEVQLLLKTLLNFTITFLLFISMFLALHYIPIKALIWSWGLYGSKILMTNQYVTCFCNVG